MRETQPLQCSMKLRMAGINTSRNKRWLQLVMSENDVTPEEQEIIRKSNDSSDLMIAMRTHNRTEGAPVHVNYLAAQDRRSPGMTGSKENK